MNRRNGEAARARVLRLMQNKSATNSNPARDAGRIIETRVYSFDELSDKAKEKARQWWREGNFEDSFWSECTIDEALEQGKLLGITFKYRGKTPCIWWSGFCSQGDGACFEGSWSAGDVKADKVAEGWGEDCATTEIKRIAKVFAEIAKKYPHASFSVSHRGRYSHENCTEFEIDLDGVEQENSSISPEAWDETCDELKETARDFMRWIYSRLEKEWEYQNSDEVIDETIRANDYAFTEEGGRSITL